MTNKKKSPYQWFLQPLDADTNSALAANIPDGEPTPDLKCGDGKRRDLWAVPHSKLSPFITIKMPGGVRVRIFVRKGNNGPIRPWKFEGGDTTGALKTRRKGMPPHVLKKMLKGKVKD